MLKVASAKYGESHSAWRAQVAGLGRELDAVARKDPVGASPFLRFDRSDGLSDEESKGTIETVVLSLASAETVRAAALVVREWLKRDTGRSVSMEIVQGDGKVVMKGQGGAGIRAAMEAFHAELERRPPEGADEEE